MKFSYLASCAVLLFVSGCGGSSNGGSDIADVTSDSSQNTENEQVSEGTQVIDVVQHISINGSGVKGPMANATVRIYQVDLVQSNLLGNLLATGITDANAQVSGIELSQSTSGYITVEFEANQATIDITSGEAPLYNNLKTVVTADFVLEGNSVYATPLTTLAVEVAIENADKLSPYNGNDDGLISEPEFANALNLAQSQVKTTLGFGLSAELDIFSVPPLLTSETDTNAEQFATAAYRQANEALAAVTAEISTQSTAVVNAQDIFEALSEDLIDGSIDGQNGDELLDTFSSLDQPIAEAIMGINPDTLIVPGTQVLVSDIQNILITEVNTDEVIVDTTALIQGEIEISLGELTLVSDADGDGVNDSLDAFPLDETESVDSDSDGVGDNSDVFPNNALESSDADNDRVGDNSDAFPNDPLEMLDSDGDSIGDNSDEFPDNALESSDTDNDGVGDNSDAFPNDPLETLDSDGDSVGDNSDVFPDNALESSDTDNDGVGDNSDAYPDDPEKSILESYTVGMWLGEQSGEIILPSNAKGVSVYSTNELDCDFTDYLNCSNGSFQTFLEQDLVSNAAQSTMSSYHNFVINDLENKIEVSTTRWSKRKNTQVIVFNDRIWVIAGYDSQGQNSEVWSSQDGDTWVQVTATAAFGQRFDHSVTVFNNKMWLLGGTRYAENAATIRLNDVWSSSDGKNWVLENDSPPFPLRSTPSLLSFDGKLWMMAGTGEDYTGKNDVWYTTNGIDWTQATAAAPWEPLNYTSVVTFNNQMMLIGGGGLYEKVWTSTNGADWTEQETDYPARNVSSLTVHDDKVWLVGGYSNSGYLNDVWVSADGISFTEVDSDYFFKRAEVGLVSFNDRLWIIGGRQGSGYGDVMSSQAGMHWIRHNFGPTDMRPRYYHSMVSLNQKLFIFGGSSFSGDESIWSSNDGLSWDKIVENAPFDNRYGLNSIAFNGKIFLYGGILRDGVNAIHAKNDIWSTTDGISWTNETESANFSARANFGLTLFNDKLWIVGGSTEKSNSELNDVWSSDDGINWTLMTDNAEFSVRKNHSLVTLNDKLWVLGGDASVIKYEDVWSSEDGITWTQATLSTTELFRPRDVGVRQGFKAISYNNKIFVISGKDSGDLLADVWSSSDGSNWIEETENSGMHGRSGFAVTVFDENIYLNGGFYSDGIAYYLKDVWRSDNGRAWSAGFHKEVTVNTAQ